MKKCKHNLVIYYLRVALTYDGKNTYVLF